MAMTPTIFMFSGQGSQQFMMGAELYEKHPGFRYWLDLCDSLVQPLLGESLISILYRSQARDAPFDRLLHSNPALVSIQYSLARTIMEAGIRPDIVLGYSLGELTAAVISGATTLQRALQFSIEFAAAMERYAPAGRMVAVIASQLDTRLEMFKPGGCWAASSNFAAHMVWAGAPGAMARLEAAARDEGLIVQALPVRFPFHTPMLAPLKETILQCCNDEGWGEPRITQWSCNAAAAIESFDYQFFWQIATSSINFTRVVQALENKGPYSYIDVGPTGTLAAFVKYNLPTHSRSTVLESLNPGGRDLAALDRLKARMAARSDRQYA